MAEAKSQMDLNPFKAAQKAGEASVQRLQDVNDGLVQSKTAFQILSPTIQSRVVRPDQHSKAGRIVERMTEAGFTKQQINDVVLALVALRDEEMKAAFELFAGADNLIDTEEMKTVVPMIGENLDEEQIRCLFVQADKDQSGSIDFPEFCQMMYSLTPKAKTGGILDRQNEFVHCTEALDTALAALDADPSDQGRVEALATAYADLIAAEVAVAEATADQNKEPFGPRSLLTGTLEAGKKAKSTVVASTALKPEIQARIIRPQDHQRAGRVIERMRAWKKKKFSGEDINNVILSLVVRPGKDFQEMAAAYALWAGEDERIDAGELKEVIPLLGEDCTPEEIDCMFNHADTDGSGFIEFKEFRTMMLQMQLKGDGRERYMLVGLARAQAYADSKM